MLGKERQINQDHPAQRGKIAFLLESFPLESCRREVCNSVTGQRGWRAPENKAFRISGQFEVFFDQSGEESDYWSMPQPSVDRLKADYAERYRKYLEEANGDGERALGLLVKNMDDDGGPPLYARDEMPVDFFEGKWLVIPPDLKDLDMTVEKPSIKIKGNVEAWYEKEHIQLIRDIAPQSNTITECLFESAVVTEHWKQNYAEAILGNCRIELVDFKEQEAKFFVLKPENDRKLILPLGVSTRKRLSKGEQEKLGDFTNKSDYIFSSVFSEETNLALPVFGNIPKLVLPKKQRKT